MSLPVSLRIPFDSRRFCAFLRAERPDGFAILLQSFSLEVGTCGAFRRTLCADSDLTFGGEVHTVIEPHPAVLDSHQVTLG